LIVTVGGAVVFTRAGNKAVAFSKRRIYPCPILGHRRMGCKRFFPAGLFISF
jgi:hypothetical protein